MGKNRRGQAPRDRKRGMKFPTPPCTPKPPGPPPAPRPPGSGCGTGPDPKKALKKILKKG